MQKRTRLGISVKHLVFLIVVFNQKLGEARSWTQKDRANVLLPDHWAPQPGTIHGNMPKKLYEKVEGAGNADSVASDDFADLI